MILNVTIRIRSPAICPFHAGQSSFPFNGDFCFSCDRYQIFNFRFADLVSFIFTVYSEYHYLAYTYTAFFTLDGFTLLVVLPKNKIRSIINSFIINTELPRLLIFLYCSPGIFSHLFETLLLLLLCPGSNISNELLSMGFHSGYPAFLSQRDRVTFFQTHHNYIWRVLPSGNSIFARDRKTVSIAIHLIANLRKQFRR